MNDKKFTYRYRAPTDSERKEIDGIRRQYVQDTSQEEDKLQRLRTLHAKVQNTAICVGLIFGVVGCLIFGLGLTAVLEWLEYGWGISLAAIGGIIMGCAYPFYKRSLRKAKKKYGEEILRLSEEILGEG